MHESMQHSRDNASQIPNTSQASHQSLIHTAETKDRKI